MKNSRLLIVCMCILIFAACKSTTSTSISSSQLNENKSATTATASGIIQEQGVTTYQYGTHVLLDMQGNTQYALKSNIIKLNNYIGKKVTVQGVPVDGYPIEGGPEFMEVVTINE